MTGDNVYSGFLGLAYSPLTNAYANTTTSADSRSKHIHIYTPSIMATIFSSPNLSLAKKFSLAVSRGKTNPSNGGLLSIGGTPDLADPQVNVTTTEFASARLEAAVDQAIQKVDPGHPELAWYAITVDSLYYGNIGNISTNTSPAQYIVDSGNPSIQLPGTDADRFHSMFFPPAIPQGGGAYHIYCNATVPDLTIMIGGMPFPINPVDVVGLPIGNQGLLFEQCMRRTEYAAVCAWRTFSPQCACRV